MNTKNDDRFGSYHILGVDIGSVSAGMVILNARKEAVKILYEFHHGDVARTVEKMLGNTDVSSLGNLCCFPRSGVWEPPSWH